MKLPRHEQPDQVNRELVAGAERLKLRVASSRFPRILRAGLRVRPLFVVILLTLLGSSSFGQQTTWYVDALAPPGGTGSQSSPYADIQMAITAASTSDVILVQPGTYSTINFLAKDIAVISASGNEVTIIQGTTGTPAVSFANGEGPLASLTGFTIKGGNAATGGGINCSSGSPIITSCTIAFNVAQSNGAGVFVGPNESPVFRNCVIANNISALNGGGVYVSINATPRFINCTVSGNTANGTGGGFYMNSMAQAEIVNSIVWENLPGEIALASIVQPLVVHSIVKGGYFGVAVVNADPIFIDPFNLDFHICGASPAMDTGTSAVSGLPPTDFEGDPRMSGAGVDIGADEFVPPVGISTWYVDSSAPVLGSGCGLSTLPFLTIQKAIDVATTGDLVLVSPGLYIENLDFKGKDITVRSVNGPLSTIVDGGGLGTTVSFLAGETSAAVLDGFTIKGGQATSGGGVLVSNASPTLVNCIIENNTAGDGGGVSCTFGAAPNITGCVIDSNQATSGMGGGIFCDVSSSPVLLTCSLNNNSANLFGGGLYTDSAPVLTSVDFTNNTSGMSGGGVFCDNDASPTLTSCTFTSNQASLDGGGVACDPQGGFSASNTTWTSNSAGRHGGGVSFLNTGSMNLAFCTLDFNTAGQLGGGLHIGPMTAGNIVSSTISNGTAVGEGAGAYIGSDAPVTFSLCTVSSNSATFGRGGGILIRDNTFAIIDGCIIDSNTANGFLTGSGGGIACIDTAAPVIADCTIISNTASDWGGGILIEAGSAPTITGCVVDGNGALSGGGIGCRSFSNAHIERCRISSNTALMNGGGLAITDSTPVPIGLELVQNTAGGKGGGVYCDNASPILVNVTIAANQAATGGGLFAQGTSAPTVTNSILWGDSPDEIVSPLPLGVTYCNVAGGHVGVGNLSTGDPFNAPASGDYHLRLDSPCRNAGNNAAAMMLATDIDGDDRIVEGTVDIGADETYFLTLGQAGGGGNLTISLHNLPPNDLYLTVFTFNVANQVPNFGGGWWGGLHISLFDVISQAAVGQPPFLGFLDATGSSAWSINGSPAVAGLSGVTIYSVTQVFDPINYFGEGWSNLVAYTFW